MASEQMTAGDWILIILHISPWIAILTIPTDPPIHNPFVIPMLSWLSFLTLLLHRRRTKRAAFG